MTAITPDQLQTIIEAALFVSGQPLTIAEFQRLFQESEQPSSTEIKAALDGVKARHAESGIELKEVASGYRLQAKADLSPWLSRLWEERAPRYSRAFLETLAIIAYKQPITRAEIEDIRGVTVSSHIVKTMLDREWIRIIGHRDIPGKPAILGTTKEFLDYFNLKSLTDLPTLAEFKNLEAQEAQLQVQLALNESEVGPINSEEIPEERDALLSEENNVVAFPEEKNTEDEPEASITEEDTDASIDEFASTRE
jgi:segregation and condensation protein B